MVQKKQNLVAKFNGYQGKQRVLDETRRLKRKDIYVYKDFSKASAATRQENWDKVKALRQQGKYAVLV